MRKLIDSEVFLINLNSSRLNQINCARLQSDIQAGDDKNVHDKRKLAAYTWSVSLKRR